MSDDLIKALQKEAREDAEIITRLRAENEKLREQLRGEIESHQALAKAYENEIKMLKESREIIRLRDELAAVTAERDRMRDALERIDGMATTICMRADAGYGMTVETVMPIYETARAAIEGVTEKSGAGNE